MNKRWQLESADDDDGGSGDFPEDLLFLLANVAL